MKWYTITLMAVALAISVVATPYPMCEGKREIQSNCTMTTPVVTNCTSYDYQIYNITGNLKENGSLTILNEANSLYSFNFTQEEGDYVVHLCDGTTREIRVTQEDTGRMIIGVLILLPIIFAFLLIWATMHLAPEFLILKKFLWLLSFIFFLMSINLGLNAFTNFYDIPAFEDALVIYSFWVSMIFWSAVLGLFFMIIWDSFKFMKTRRLEKFNN